MRKEAVYMTWIAMALAILSIFAITVPRLAESWSQTHNTKFDPLLYTTLICIMVTYLLRYFFHPDSEKYTLWKFKQKTIDLTTAVFFFFVAVFGVNSEVGWVSTLHIVFTALAIVTANVGMLAYPYKKKMGLNGAIFASAVGVGIFIFAYFWPWITTADGELYVALPLIGYLIVTTKN